MSVPLLDQLLDSFDAALTEEISTLEAHAVTGAFVSGSSAPQAFQRNLTVDNLALAPEEKTPDPVDDAQPLISSIHLLHRLKERLQAIGQHLRQIILSSPVEVRLFGQPQAGPRLLFAESVFLAF